VREKTSPQNRSEQEIAGYREVLKTVHLNHSNMDFSVNLVLQLHRDLFQFMPQPGGRWKMMDNRIDEVLPDGSTKQRFKPVPAFQTKEAMELLHKDFQLLWSSGDFEPLLLIPAYILDFLCIHPFSDGNGRLSRILTLLLLYQAEYRVGRYISMEQVIEKSKEGYYESLFKSSQHWHEGKHSLLPWWQYFIGVMLLNSYREFEKRVGAVTSARGAKSEMIIDIILHLPRQFRISDIEEASPVVSRPTINRVLQRMRKTGKLKCIKAGRDAVWEKQE
jgi:Fic family protein